MSSTVQPDQPGEPARPGARAQDREIGVFRYLGYAEQLIGGLLIVVIFVFVLMQAVQRYLPIPTWVGAGELSRFALAGLTFLMAGYLYGHGLHIAVLVIDRYTSGRTAKVVHVLTHVLVLLTALLLLNGIWALVSDSGSQSTPALGIPMLWIYLLPLLGIVALTVRSAVAIFVPRAIAAEPDPVIAEGAGA